MTSNMRTILNWSKHCFPKRNKSKHQIFVAFRCKNCLPSTTITLIFMISLTKEVNNNTRRKIECLIYKQFAITYL